MHEIFLLVDFFVCLICFVMSQQIIQIFVQKHKQNGLKNLRWICLILPFYKIYWLKTCKCAHVVAAAFWLRPGADLGPIAITHHQHTLFSSYNLLVDLCECATLLTVSLWWASAHIQPYRCLDGASHHSHSVRRFKDYKFKSIRRSDNGFYREILHLKNVFKNTNCGWKSVPLVTDPLQNHLYFSNVFIFY